MNPTSKVTAALIAGAVVGVLSSLPLLGCLCCAWAIGGGFLASYLWMRHQPPSLAAPLGDSVLLGLMTSAVATVVGIIVQLPLQLIAGANGGMQDAFDQAMEQLPADADVPQWFIDLFTSGAGSAGLTIFSVLFGAVFSFVAYSIFVSIGSLIGTSIFHKKAQ